MLTRTRTGIEIGRAYVPPPARMQREAERIQSLLLREPEHPITALGHAVAPWAALVAAVILILTT